MSKFVDVDGMLAEVQKKMAGQSTMPKSIFRQDAPREDVDVQSELNKRAEAYFSDMLDEAHKKSVKLEGIDATVMTREDRQAAALKTLDAGKRKKLAAVAVQLRAVADQADAACLFKQAASLREVASKLS
jgi:hypothetical protein